MRIIKDTSQYKLKFPLFFRCGSCFSEFEAENKDEIDHINILNENALGIIYDLKVKCPVCNNFSNERYVINIGLGLQMRHGIN